MTDTTTEHSEPSQAVGAPVERPVRPCAWIAPTPLERLRSGSPRVRVTTELRKTPEAYDVPLYDRAALDAAVAAERELWAKPALFWVVTMPGEVARWLSDNPPKVVPGA